MGRVVGVCSWSLRAGSPEELAARVRAVGCSAVQLHLDPLREGAWGIGKTARALGAAGVLVRSGMMTTKGEDYTSLESIRRTGGVRPDATWDANRRAAEGNAEVARMLGIGLVTLHAGHVPAEESDPEWGVMVERLREVAAIFGQSGVRVGLETGQETHATLRVLLGSLAGVGVNFDPANMILYGMGDPIEALGALSDRVVQVHIKDALPSGVAGAWGLEVPVGEGAVDWGAFLHVVERRCPGVDLMIEREAGDRRVEDARTALGVLRRLGVHE